MHIRVRVCKCIEALKGHTKKKKKKNWLTTVSSREEAELKRLKEERDVSH